MTRTLALVVAALAALCLALPQQAAAYNYTRTCQGVPAHWAAGNPNTVWRLSSSLPSTDLSNAQVDSQIGLAFDEWEQPGCSSFTASQGGDINADPMGTHDDHVVGFYENSWPGSLGASSLAVTFTSTWSDCEIADSDMVINGYGFDWIVGNPVTWKQADLRSVVTHEAGHWLGMDHSTYPGSSLTASYSGASDERTLTCDDSAGVCGSHSSGGNSCTNDRYCACGVGCNGGFCGGTPTDTGNQGPDSCSGSNVTYGESEPNDWEGDDDIDWWQPTGGGDIFVNGTVSCGNDGNDYTADFDWLVIDVPCIDDTRFRVDWTGNSDLDLYVWNTTDETAMVSDYSSGTVGPAYGNTNDFTGRLYALVVCWSGQTTGYSFQVDFAPFSALPDPPDTGDTGSDTGSDTETDSDTDSDADTDTDVVADETGLLDCSCAAMPLSPVPLAAYGMVLLSLAGVVVRRRD